MRWLQEIENAVPPLAVHPLLRHHVVQALVQRGASITTAQHTEAAANVHAAGRLHVYMHMVQEAMCIEQLDADAYLRWCQRAEGQEQSLSETHLQRLDVLAAIAACKFVPQAVAPPGTAMRRCRACGSTDLLYAARQTRRADEGQTVFYACNNAECTLYKKERR